MSKPKTINVTPTTHKALREYCLAAGLKLQAVAYWAKVKKAIK
jgi:hypothetical protein